LISPESNRDRLKGWLLGIPFLGVLILLFAQPLFKGWVIAVPGDVADQFWPWRVFTVQSLKQGVVPLWNPFSFCGAPFLANMQSAVLYPIDRFLDLLFDPAQAVMVGVPLHLLIGAGGVYALARRYGAGEGSSVVAATGFSLSGFNAIHLWGGNLLTVNSAVFLPWHLLWVRLLADRVEGGLRVGWIPAAAIITACLQVLSGHAQMTFYNAVFVMIFCLPILLDLGARCGRWLTWLGAVGVVSILLCAPQLLATWEYSGFASRSGTLPFLPATEFSFGWEFLPSFLLPEYLGTRADLNTPFGKDSYWGDWKNWSAVYVGILPAVGFLALFLTREGRVAARRLLPVWGPLLLIALILALGRNTPVYRLVHEYLPLFGKFRAPSKFLPGLLVPFSVLGAVGLTLLAARGEAAPKKSLWPILAILGGLGFLALLSVGSIRFPEQRWGLALRDLLRSVSLLLMAFGGIASLPRPARGNGVALVLAVVAVLDLGFYFQKHLLFGPPEKVRQFPAPLIRGFLEPGSRVLATGEIPQMAFCIPEGIPNCGGYDPLQVGMFVNNFREARVLEEGEIPDAWSPPPSWAARLGASVVLSSQRLNQPDLVPAERFIYRVEDPAPLVEFLPADPGLPGATAEASLAWGWDRGELHVSGNLPAKGELLVRQTYVPGWVARSEKGSEETVYPLEPFWQAIRVDSGPQSWVFSYEPWGWKMGVRLLPLGLVGLLGVLIPTVRIRNKDD
jgi:hypothetical protein